MSTKRVLKWDVPVDSESHVIGGGKVVHVACQHDAGSVQVWTESEGDEPPIRAKVYGTGHSVPLLSDHIGSAVAAGGALVWHVFTAPAEEQ